MIGRKIHNPRINTVGLAEGMFEGRRCWFTKDISSTINPRRANRCGSESLGRNVAFVRDFPGRKVSGYQIAHVGGQLLLVPSFDEIMRASRNESRLIVRLVICKGYQVASMFLNLQVNKSFKSNCKRPQITQGHGLHLKRPKQYKPITFILSEDTPPSTSLSFRYQAVVPPPQHIRRALQRQ